MRPAALFAISGSILLAGLGISYAGSELATAGIETAAGVLEGGHSLEVSAELDGSTSTSGVYAIRQQGDAYGVDAMLYDPDGAIVDSHRADAETAEVRFEISGSGTYTLKINNTSEDTRELIIAVGYDPDRSVAILVASGSYLIIAGMIMMGITVIYAVKRSRSSSEKSPSL